MGIKKPFRRTCRQFTNGSYAAGGTSRYIKHKAFAQSPKHYIRAFLLIQQDLTRLFDYVEPADKNLTCYSYRTHELLLRACVEVEANCKAILVENGYTKSGDMNMKDDYRKTNATHRLSSYKVRMPVWTGHQNVRSPFGSWPSGPLSWYQIYNATKHNRHVTFDAANLDAALNATCGLVVLLAAQFYTNDFGSLDYLIGDGLNDGFEVAIGNYFEVMFPSDWPDADKYDFTFKEWETLAQLTDPFENHNYG